MTKNDDVGKNEQIAALLRQALSWPPAEAEKAMGELRKIVKMRVAKLGNAWVGLDLADVVQDAMIKLLNDREQMLAATEIPSRAAGRFWMLVKNTFHDHCRRLKALRDHFSPSNAPYDESAPQETSPIDDVIQELDETCPLSDADLRIIQNLSLKRRLVSLPLVGLWQAVPPGLWERWVVEYGLRMPFPPQSFLLEPEKAKRNEILSGLLGLERNSLVQEYCRATKSLRQLARLAQRYN